MTIRDRNLLDKQTLIQLFPLRMPIS